MFHCCHAPTNTTNNLVIHFFKICYTSSLWRWQTSVNIQYNMVVCSPGRVVPASIKTDQLSFCQLFRRDENRFFVCTSEILAVIHTNNIAPQPSEYALSDCVLKMSLTCVKLVIITCVAVVVGNHSRHWYVVSYIPFWCWTCWYTLNNTKFT